MSTTAAGSAASSWRVRRDVATFDRTLKRSGGPLVERFGAQTAAVMRAEILDEYRRCFRGFPTSGDGETRARRIWRARPSSWRCTA